MAQSIAHVDLLNNTEDGDGNMKFKGFAIIPAIVTMYDYNENIDIKAQKKAVDFLLSKSVDGFYIGGGTGKGFMMNTEERKRVISETISMVGGKVPTIAYAGSLDTKTARELARHAEKEGADAISSVPPYYYEFGAAEILNYYKALSECVSIPLIAYNNSSANLTEQGIMEEVLSLPTCSGIKYTSYNHFEMKLIKLISGTKHVFSGADEMFASAMIAGVDGAIGATYNVIPELFVKMREAYIKNNNSELSRLSEASIRIIRTFLDYSLFPSMKALLEFHGIGTRVVRSPFISMDEESFKALKTELKKIKQQYGLDYVEMLEAL